MIRLPQSPSHVLCALPAAAAGAWILGLLLVTCWGRLTYPYDLEWMEGGMLVHARRILQGQPRYVRPSMEFIPFIYPPLYPALVALGGKVFGLSYTLGRVLSLGGMLAAAGALIAAIRLERGPWALALGAAGLFLASYDESAAFFDLVRNDGLLLGLLSWTLVTARAGRWRWAALLLVASYATKQSTFPFGVAIAAWALWQEGPRASLRFVAWSLIPAGLFTGAMLFEGDGMFLTYLIEVTASHSFHLSRLYPDGLLEITGAASWAVGGSLIVGLILVATDRRLTAPAVFWAVMLGMLLVMSMSMRMHTGGYLNVLIPGFWALALGSGLIATATHHRWPGPLLLFILSLGFAAQISVEGWDPQRYVPTARDVEAGDRVIEKLRSLDGPILAPHSPWYLVMAGKEPSFHLIALWDIDKPESPLRKHAIRLEKTVSGRKWTAILGESGELGRRIDRSVKGRYRITHRFHHPGRALFPKTGHSRRPEHILLPTGRN